MSRPEEDKEDSRSSTLSLSTSFQSLYEVDLLHDDKQDGNLIVPNTGIDVPKNNTPNGSSIISISNHKKNEFEKTNATLTPPRRWPAQLLQIIDYRTNMGEWGNESPYSLSVMKIRIKILSLNMLLLALKATGVAVTWEFVSDFMTFTPGDIDLRSKDFVVYSAATGGGAAAGITVGMFVGLGLTKKIYRTGDVFTRRNLMQGAQLFFETFLTDSFWAIAYRAYLELEKSSWLVVRTVSHAPLFMLGPWFILMSQLVHKISRCTNLVSQDDSFNPSLRRSVDLWIGVGVSEVCFAWAADLSTKWDLLGTRFSSGVAILLDSLFAGVMTGLGAASPYAVLLIILAIVSCLPPSCFSFDYQPVLPKNQVIIPKTFKAKENFEDDDKDDENESNNLRFS